MKIVTILLIFFSFTGFALTPAFEFNKKLGKSASPYTGYCGENSITIKVNSGGVIPTGALKDKNGDPMRGTPMVLGKSLTQSVAFAQNIENWKTIQNNGFNTVRVCWVDPYYADRSKSCWTVAEVLPYLDKCVENATATGMNLILKLYNAIRTLAPNRQILFFSFNGITQDIINVVDNYSPLIDWEHTTVAFHMYNSTTSAHIRTENRKTY